MQHYKITFSLRTILLLFLSVLGVYLAYHLRSVIIVVIFAYIINAGLRPIVNFLTMKKIPRGLAILLTYSVILVLFTILLGVIVTSAIDQIRVFAQNIEQKADNLVQFITTNLPILSNYIDQNQIRSTLESSRDLSTLTSSELFNQLISSLASIGGQGITILGSAIGVLFNLFVMVIVSVYMLGNKKNMYEGLLELMPSKYSKILNPIFTKIESSLGSWLLGQLVLMVTIGIGSYLIVIAPGFFDASYPIARYALVIAILAGVLEGVPNIGPTITMIISILIAIVSGATVPAIFYIFVMFILLQQLESLLIIPVVMKKAVNLSPVVSILSVVAGFELGGPIGALIAVPIVGVVQIVVLELSVLWKRSEEKKVGLKNVKVQS